MTNIRFASNNLVHWPLSESSQQNGSFDTTRVPYSIFLNNQQAMSSVEFAPVAGTVTWVHFRLWFNGTADGNSAEDYFLIKAFDVSGNLLYQLDMIPTFDPDHRTKLTLYRNGGSVTGDQQFPFNESKMNTVDIRYELTGSLINLKLYVNGGLAKNIEYTGTADFTQVNSLRMGAAFTDIAGSKQYMSEFIVADADTRNARLNLLRPTAVGGETDWVGVATDLADNDPTSGMTSIAANERQTLDLSAYTGAGNISALVVATVALAGANAPQNIRHTVRMATTNYDSPGDILLGELLTYNLTDFQINPATSVPWISTDLTNLEMGFISKA